MVELDKIKSDMELMRQRIDAFAILRNEYEGFVNKLPFAASLPARGRPEKIIWSCWLQGIGNAPDIVRACHKCLWEKYPDYEKILITEENFSHYINIPPHILKKWREGIITNNGFANILRLALLIKFGGLWLDATVLCTAENIPSYISDYPFFAYSSWKYITGDIRPLSNWCMAAAPGHTLIRAVYSCLCQYWHDHDDLVDYFIFHMFFRLVIARYAPLWCLVPRVNNVPPHLMQFEMDRSYSEKRFAELKSMSAFHKLTWRVPPEIINNSQSLYRHIMTASL